MKRLLAMAMVGLVLTTAVSLWAYLSGSRTLHAEARELTTAIAASSHGNELAGSGSNANASASPDGRAQALVDHAHAWAKRLTLATATTGLGLTAMVLGAAAFWQRRIGNTGGANSASPTQLAGRGAHTHTNKTVPLPTLKTGGVTAEAVVQQLRFELSTHVKERRKIEAELTDLKTQFDKRLDERTAAVSAELNQRKQAEKTLSQQRQELERSKDVLELHVQARTQQLQTLQRRHEHILNSAGEGIYGLDMQGKTTFVNPAAAKLTGYTVEELLGKTENQTILHKPSGPHLRPDTSGSGAAIIQPTSGQSSSTEHTRIGRDQIAPNTPIITTDTEHSTGHTRAVATNGTRLVGRASAPGSSPEGLALSSASARPSATAETVAPHPANITAHTSGEQTFYRKDGTPVLVEYTRTPIIENNKQMGTVVTFKDITERKRAEETLARKAAELARSNGELEQFAYVASHDLQEPLRKIRAFGDRLKTTIDQLTGGVERPESSADPDSIGRPNAGNTQIRRRKTKTADTQITPRTVERPEPSADSARPEGPRPSTLDPRPTLVGSARDYLERMQNAAARMQTLINDLLTFSRVISTTQPFIPVDLAAITREVLGDLELRIQQTGAKIHLGDLPTIHADPMQMRQLLQNIIANALKFQPTGPGANAPEIKITSQHIDAPFATVDIGPHSGHHLRDGVLGAQNSYLTSGLATTQAVELTIQDNGIGFDPKYTDKIFAMFQRLHGRSEYEGTGVGLAVCRRITDRHSGTITATSQPGQGATFTIRLPVQQTNKEKQPA
jgi:signal transduction histidine kinase